MTRRRDILSQFTNVGAGLTATARLPVDRRYFALKIKYAENGVAALQATMEASITQIRLLVNGSEQRTMSAAELNAMNLSYGYKFSDGVIAIFFAEPARRLPLSEDFGAWNMRGRAREFQIEVDVLAGVVNPTLECLGEYDVGGGAPINGSPFPPGSIKKISRQIVQVGAAGLVTLNDLPLAGSYHRLHAFEVANGDVTNVRVVVGDQNLYNWPRDLMIDGIERRGGTVANALFTVAFDETLSLNEMLRTQVFERGRLLDVPVRVEFTLANANNLTLLSEVWAPL